MGLWRFFLPILLVACAHSPKVSVVTPEALLPKMKLVGEGKARLEIAAESWVFSYDAAFKDDSTWLMALQVPTQGEMVFAFPGLDRPRASIEPSADDFRYRIVHALRDTSNRRRLSYPEAGQEFIQRVHHLLRWVKPGARPAHQCRELEAFKWDCELDKQKTLWTWNKDKQELQVLFKLKPFWTMQATFKNVSDTVFKRVTLEIVRQGENQKFVELRQELFLSTP